MPAQMNIPTTPIEPSAQSATQSAALQTVAGVVVDQAKRNAKGAVSKAGRVIESEEQRKRWGR